MWTSNRLLRQPFTRPFLPLLPYCPTALTSERSEPMYDQQKVAEALRAFERGEIVVVMDDDGRENEGDLIVAAVHCTPEKMAFIVRYTSGIVCTPMTREDAKRFNLAPMVADNDAPHSTAFTVSVDFKHGTTTGISADDRTLTVRNLANGNAGASDFVRPGHIFPLIAREGGVLMRSGHTEAAVDLCKLAGLPPVGVICELVNDDGSVKRGPQVRAFAEEHGLKQVSVADLIAYRQRQETLVDRVESFDVDTPGGKARASTYTLPWDSMQHLAVVFGDIRDGVDVPVRLHPENVVSDVFGTGQRLDAIMRMMGEQRRGVIVYLREGSVGVGHQARNRGGQAEEHDEARNRENEWREIGLGAQILKDLGISSIILIASRERHYVGLEGFGIRIAKTEIL
jgi:3,4-dihydroxy 2-butanone 4-phosphate synthase/GTP cyclohydrolase II